MKALVYTSSLYLFVLLILSLAIFTLTLNQWEIKKSIELENEKKVSLTIEEIKILSLKVLGLDVKSFRNQTDFIFKIKDNGFPLNQALDGQVKLADLKNFLEGEYKKLRSCEIFYNVSNINQTGNLINTNYDLTYLHNNSAPNSDYIILDFQPTIQLKELKIKLNCTRPVNASNIVFQDLQNNPSGVKTTINFYDGTTTYSNSANISLNSDNRFLAKYLDNNNNFVEQIYVDYNSTQTKLLVWSETNSTYSPPYSKQNVSCAFEFESILNSTQYQEVKASMPIYLNISCSNINYFGDLVLLRK
jgi:hypothetical protein